MRIEHLFTGWYNQDDAVDVIGHDDVGIQFNLGADVG